MCFSAGASFITAGSLSVLGVYAINKVKTGPRLYMAIVPLLFGAQQAIEGLLWLTYTNRLDAHYQPILAFGFLAFAFSLWSWYIPYSLLQLEIDPQRAYLLRILLGVGISIAMGLGFLLLQQGAQPSVHTHHISYDIKLPLFSEELYLLWYCLAVIVPFFVSSLSWAPLFGGLVLLACMASAYLWHHAFGSMWCFWSALLSMLIAHII